MKIPCATAVLILFTLSSSLAEGPQFNGWLDVEVASRADKIVKYATASCKKKAPLDCSEIKMRLDQFSKPVKQPDAIPPNPTPLFLSPNLYFDVDPKKPKTKDEMIVIGCQYFAMLTMIGPSEFEHTDHALRLWAFSLDRYPDMQRAYCPDIIETSEGKVMMIESSVKKVFLKTVSRRFKQNFMEIEEYLLWAGP